MTTLDEPASGTIKLRNGFDSSSCTTESVLDTTRTKCLSKCLSFESVKSKALCKESPSKEALGLLTSTGIVSVDVVSSFQPREEISAACESKMSNNQVSSGL